MPAAYKSSVMRYHDPDDDDCATCRFLKGDKSSEVLLDVISNLDHMLFDEETLTETLVKTFHAGSTQDVREDNQAAS